MKTIIFIGTQKSGSSREALKIANKMGYSTILLTNRRSHIEHRDDFPFTNEMIYCDLSDYDLVKLKIKDLIDGGIKVESIISFIDKYVYMASRLEEDFNINVFTSEAIYRMSNKILSRRCLKSTAYAPNFLILEKGSFYSINEIQKMLPVVLKKPKSTGSKDVYLVKTMSEFINKLDKMVHEENGYQVIVEEFLKGPQILVETIVENKKVHIIACIEQDIEYANGHFIVTGYHTKYHIDKNRYMELKSAVENIIQLHGMQNGSCHLELRYIEEKWKLIEINPRISGGAMNILLQKALGINLIEQILNLSLKKKLSLEPKYYNNISIKYLFTNDCGRVKSVIGRGKALMSPGIIDVFIKPKRGNYIHPPSSMGHRLAYVIATGYNEMDAKENAKNAADLIEFKIK